MNPTLQQQKQADAIVSRIVAHSIRHTIDSRNQMSNIDLKMSPEDVDELYRSIYRSFHIRSIH